MSSSVIIQFFAAASIALAGLFLARGQGVALTQEQAGLLMVAGAVVLMLRAINQHFDRPE